MIDNTHVVVLSGSGRDMVPVPEMAAFGERFGFGSWRTRSATRIVRHGSSGPSHFIENNFLAGRPFAVGRTSTAGARLVRQGQRHSQETYARRPRELFAVERPHLKPLPAWIPEVYALHHRIVDIEGYVALHATATRCRTPDRAARRGARDQRQGRDSTRGPPRRHPQAASSSRARARHADHTVRRAARDRRAANRIPKNRPGRSRARDWPRMSRALKQRGRRW